MNYVFEIEKKYKITIKRNNEDLTFTATKVKLIGTLISFIDKYNQQLIFPLEALQQASEIKMSDY